MTLAELKKILDAAGYPVAYSHFTATATKPIPDPPYITYLVSYSSNFIADNKVHKKIDNAQIELYTVKKDLAAESNLETALDSNDIPYQSTETFIESENLFQKIYEVRLF
ncbi:hypothetical protein BTO30_12465 [Domibacillus antri]|uniref:Prophage pi2 protein 38 n=1 Tax=Domibacillus antri TaxID=1714264 RepID=A0A1Q8Q3N3_9BACI|nr:hypothetical protein [Domibacillus antri]OLN21905.1 hypothetical protein BTO30_12465 [Domibacillus antri]